MGLSNLTNGGGVRINLQSPQEEKEKRERKRGGGDLKIICLSNLPLLTLPFKFLQSNLQIREFFF